MPFLPVTTENRRTGIGITHTWYRMQVFQMHLKFYAKYIHHGRLFHESEAWGELESTEWNSMGSMFGVTEWGEVLCRSLMVVPIWVNARRWQSPDQHCHQEPDHKRCPGLHSTALSITFSILHYHYIFIHVFFPSKSMFLLGYDFSYFIIAFSKVYKNNYIHNRFFRLVF